MCAIGKIKTSKNLINQKQTHIYSYFNRNEKNEILHDDQINKDENIQIDQKQEQKAKKILFIKAVISNMTTIANTQIGVSILQTPYIFAHMGLIPATIVMLAFAIFSVFGMSAINTVASYTMSRNVKECLDQIVPKKVAMVLDLLTIFEQQSFLISYISVASSYLQICIKAWFNYDFNLIYLKLILFPIVILITVFGQPKVLSTICSFAILFVLFTVLSVFSTYMIALRDGYVNAYDQKNEYITTLPNVVDLLYPMMEKPGAATLDFISKIPLLLPLFAAITPQPLLNADLNNDESIWSIKEANNILCKSCIAATCVSGFCEYLLAISGLLLFGHNVFDNILLNYSPRTTLITVCRFLYSLVVLCTYGVIVFPPRRMIMGYIKFKSQKREKIWFHVIGLLMCIISVGLSIAVPSISKILSIFCSLFSVGIRFEFPLFFIILKEKIMGKSKYLAYEDLTRKQCLDLDKNQQLFQDKKSIDSQLMNQKRPSLILVRNVSVFKQILRQSFVLTHEPQYLQEKQEERKDLQRDIFNEDKRQYSLVVPTQNSTQLRPASIAINEPAHVNDVAAEIQQKNKNKEQKTQKTTTLLSNATISLEDEAESVDEAEENKQQEVNQLEQKRYKLLHYRSKSCFIFTCIIAILFLLINYTAFACQFVDIESI